MYANVESILEFSKSLVKGMEELSALAAKTLSTGKKIQFITASGEYKSSSHFKDVVLEARFSDTNTNHAIAALKSKNIPDDGVKTAIILCDSFLKQAKLLPLFEKDLKGPFLEVLEYCKDYLSRIADGNKGMLPGGGLYLMTLIKPVWKYTNNKGWNNLGKAFSKIFISPMLIISANAGIAEHEAFERIKAMAPNQFFSLNHVGLERSIKGYSDYVDVIHMGFDRNDKKIKDLLEAGIAEPLSVGRDIIDCLGCTVETLRDIAETVP
jgi:chaperonin GroEL (HSP60 family)